MLDSRLASHSVSMRRLATARTRLRLVKHQWALARFASMT
jgi:hypothetical protein